MKREDDFPWIPDEKAMIDPRMIHPRPIHIVEKMMSYVLLIEDLASTGVRQPRRYGGVVDLTRVGLEDDIPAGVFDTCPV